MNDSSKAPLSIEPVRKPWGEWASRGSSEGDESMVKSVFPAELSYCAPRFFRKEPSRIRFWILETGSIEGEIVEEDGETRGEIDFVDHAACEES